jgi:FKBP-type peptidyl-prolyl cis-trans isomerase 2
MISFKPAMQNEKIAVIALVVIIIGALSIYLIATNDTEIFNNLFNGTDDKIKEKSIALGDCADVNYIGRYVSNNTIFDSSYEYSENKSGGVPLQMFISINNSEISPKPGYVGIIEGLAEGLVGLKENDTATIGPIPPEKAYGNKLKVGDTFTTKVIALELNQTVEVTDYTDEYLSLKWIDFNDLGSFTMPIGILLENLENAYYTGLIHDYLPPYYLWENSSEIISIMNETIEVTTTPTNNDNIVEEMTMIPIGENLELFFVFPDATTAIWDNDTISLTSSPQAGTNYLFTSQGINLTFSIDNVSNSQFNISYFDTGGQITPLGTPINKTINFNRTIKLRHVYNNIPISILDIPFAESLFGLDLEKNGYSLNKLSGESLTFEVEIVKIYKSS